MEGIVESFGDRYDSDPRIILIEKYKKRIEEHNLGVIQGQYTVQTFTEKFDSLCAGAYVSLNIQVQVLECNCCENKINLVTSVNGKTGDVIIKGYEGSSLEHVNITEAEYNKLTEE